MYLVLSWHTDIAFILGCFVVGLAASGCLGFFCTKWKAARRRKKAAEREERGSAYGDWVSPNPAPHLSPNMRIQHQSEESLFPLTDTESITVDDEDKANLTEPNPEA